MAASSSHVLVFAVHAAPGAKRTEAVGAYGESLKVRLAAQPVDGKANDVLHHWLAKTFEVRMQCIELLSGQTSRSKRWSITCGDAQDLLRCQTLLSRLKSESKN